MDAVTEISQLVLQERQARDRGWWDRLRSAYATDSTVRLSWFTGSGRDFVTASQQMMDRGDVAVHRLSPPVVHLNGDRALVELPGIIEVRTTVAGVDVDLESRARLWYRTERRAGRWLIVALDPVYERDTLTAVYPGTELTVTPADVAAFRPAYRFLSYVLSQRGYSVGDDLYGDDHPDHAGEFYRHSFAWLGVDSP
jgi:SnoaL-like domain